MNVFVKKTITFDTAHALKDYDGKCAFIHGHTYKAEISVYGQIDPVTGFVMDFSELGKIIKDYIDNSFDHKFVVHREDVRFPMSVNMTLMENNPTCENMVVAMLEYLKKKVNNAKVAVYSIELWETPTSCAIVIDPSALFIPEK